MKQLARYKVNFDSPAILFSAAMMGISFFAQAIYFLVLNQIQEISKETLILFMILPMVLETGWVILLKCKLNAAGVYGIIGSVVCVLLTVQIFMAGNVAQMIFGTIVYLLGIGLLVMITAGFFPYKYIGMVLFGLIGCGRLCFFDMPRYIRPGDWQGFVLELAGLCMIFSLMLFFGGISGKRNME